MAQCDVVEKPLLERIQSELEADSDLYDVTFSVGPQKTRVKALKIILMAASPVFKDELKTKLNNTVIKDGEGIPLPEFDVDSFQLFVKLTSLDTWSVEVLQKLNLPPNQLLDLLSFSRRYEIRTAVKSVETITAAFIQSFAKFKDTADFLRLSQANLKEVLASDDLPLEEMEVFKCALKEQIDVQSLGFYAKRRNSYLLPKPESNSVELQPQQQQTPVIHAAAQAFEVTPSSSLQLKGTPTEKPPGCSTLSLLSKSRRIDANNPFVCDGSLHRHQFISEQKVAVIGLGFAGPIDADAIYDVTVNINACSVGDRSSLTGGTIIKKNIFVLKDQTFYFVFDEPVTLEKNQWRNIWYSLKGPNTSSIVDGHGKDTTLQEGSNEFKLYFISNQLSEILFKRL